MATKVYYSKETGKRQEIDYADLWNTLFIQICQEKARLSLPDLAFRLGILSSQGNLFYTIRGKEKIYGVDSLSPFEVRALEICRTNELELLGTNYELPTVQKIIEDYLMENFICGIIN